MGENYTLFAQQAVDKSNLRKLTLFQEGYFRSPKTEISFEECPSYIQFEDYNFEGCPDMIVSSTIIYLWNTDKKEYEAVQMPEDFPTFFFEREYGYQCDLNNDGVLEQFNKSIWRPSNLWTVVHIELSGEGPGIKALKDAVWSVEGMLIMLWAGPFAGKNIVHVISLTGLNNKTEREKITELDDFTITGFLVEGTQYQRVYQITVDAAYAVRQEYENTQERR